MSSAAKVPSQVPLGVDRIHSAVFAAAAAAATLAWLLTGDRIPLAAELALVAAAVALLGIPHGALDLVLMRSLAARLGDRRSLSVLLAVYLVLAVIVIAAWVAYPAPSLAVFLIASALHFGIEDTQRRLSAELGYLLETLLRGAAPVILPVAFHPEESTWLFSQLIPADGAAILVQVVSALWPMLAVLGALLLIDLLARSAANRPREWRTLTEVSSVCLLFLLAPPLVAFAVYFGLLHSARHLLRYARRCGPMRARDAARALVRDAMPMTLLTWLLALAALLLFPLERIGVQPTMQVLFIGLAALTAPHALLLIGLRLLGEPASGVASSAAKAR